MTPRPQDRPTAAQGRGDRTVHARLENDAEVVRYERAGKWYIEPPGEKRNLVMISEAVDAALLPGSRVIFDQPGGGSFDAKVRRRRGC